jgi:hypothetical protein
MGATQGIVGRLASILLNRVLNFNVLSETGLLLVFRPELICLHMLCALQGYLDMIKYHRTLFIVLQCRVLGFSAQGSLVVL